MKGFLVKAGRLLLAGVCFAGAGLIFGLFAWGVQYGVSVLTTNEPLACLVPYDGTFLVELFYFGGTTAALLGPGGGWSLILVGLLNTAAGLNLWRKATGRDHSFWKPFGAGLFCLWIAIMGAFIAMAIWQNLPEWVILAVRHPQTFLNMLPGIAIWKLFEWGIHWLGY